MTVSLGNGVDIGNIVTSQTNPLTGGIKVSGLPVAFGNEQLSTAIFGDSIIANYGGTEAIPSFSSNDNSIIGWLFAATGQPFKVTWKGGVSGEKCSQILSRLTAKITSAGQFDSVFIEMGTNNLNNAASLYGGTDSTAAGLAVADIYAQYKAAIDHCVGKVPAIFVIGMFPFQSTFGLTAALKAVQGRVNAKLDAYCRSVGACYLDSVSPFVDANGLDAKPSRMTDDFHPGNNGAREFGVQNAPRVNQFIKSHGIGQYWATSGTFASDTSAKQLIPNPMMYGTAGQFFNGATGSLPDGYDVYKPGGAGASTCAASIVAANVGSGFATRLTLGSLVSGEQWALRSASFDTPAFTDPSGTTQFINAGDSFYVEAIVKTAGASGVLKGLTIQATYAVTGGALNGTNVYPYALSYTSSTADVFDAEIPALHFRSPVMQMPSDATLIDFSGASVVAIAGGSGSCTVDIEKFAIVKL